MSRVGRVLCVSVSAVICLASCTNHENGQANDSDGEFKIVYTKNKPDSIESRSIAAFESASNIEIISLLPWDVGAYFSAREKIEPPSSASETVEAEFEKGESARQQQAQEAWCQPGPCIDGNRVLGRVFVDQPGRKDALRSAIKGWYESFPDFAAGCVPEYHHALAFTSGGKRYQVLLCFHCGQYKIFVDGKPTPEGQLASFNGMTDMNAWFKEAGIPYDVPEN